MNASGSVSGAEQAIPLQVIVAQWCAPKLNLTNSYPHA